MGETRARQALRCSVPLLLLLLLSTCGNGREDPDGAPDPKTDPRTPYDPATFPLASRLDEKHTDDLDGILERRYIRILTTFNKTNFFISGSRLYGFEYSLLRDYGKALNKQIGNKGLSVVMEFIPVPRNELIPLLLEGLGDIAAAGLTITAERKKQVDFTDPYLTNVAEVVVTNRKTTGLSTLEDLSGRNVYVRESSSYYESIVNLNRRFAEKGRPPVRIIKVDESLETGDILEIVNSGAIPITIADDIIGEIWSGVFHNLRIHQDLQVRKGSQIAWMVRKGSPELRKSLNAFIKKHRKGTLLGNIYFERYFEKNKWIKNPLTRKEMEKQLRVTSLFKKYGEQYGFDWMLIMALAYQESRLDNEKKSPSGAVGILQVRPSTASDRHIGIRNVKVLENNVHAGVKYLAYLRDRYFSSHRINQRNRIRFTLAAYNAGPKTIKKAQKMAEEMDLDRYRWFRNVEIATLRIVGQETAQYVSNVNKYYVLFKLHEETERLRESSKQESLAKGAPR